MGKGTSTRVALAAALLFMGTGGWTMTDEDQSIVDRGFDALYRADYEGSEKIFDMAIQQKPEDPVRSLGRAVAAWWRMENDFAPLGGEEERTFLDAVQRAIETAKNAAKRNDPDALVCLGGAYGLRGRWEAAHKHWFRAYRDGRRAYLSERQAVKVDPSLNDAYLGLGAFDYYVATLSRFVRIFIFTKGNKARGLAELQKATQGRFTATAAKLLLVGIDWTFEKKPREAWALLEEVHARYPDSPLIDSMRLIGLFQLRDGEGLQREARVFLKRAEEGAPFYRPIDKAAGHYFIGLGLQLSGHPAEALEQHQRALELLPQEHRTRGVPHLFIGECLDLLDRREEAVGFYRQTLRDPPFWGVQRYAKFLIKHPFRLGDNPLPSREDELD